MSRIHKYGISEQWGSSVVSCGVAVTSFLNGGTCLLSRVLVWMRWPWPAALQSWALGLSITQHFGPESPSTPSAFTSCPCDVQVMTSLRSCFSLGTKFFLFPGILWPYTLRISLWGLFWSLFEQPVLASLDHRCSLWISKCFKSTFLKFWNGGTHLHDLGWGGFVCKLRSPQPCPRPPMSQQWQRVEFPQVSQICAGEGALVKMTTRNDNHQNHNHKRWAP